MVGRSFVFLSPRVPSDQNQGVPSPGFAGQASLLETQIRFSAGWSVGKGPSSCMNSSSTILVAVAINCRIRPTCSSPIKVQPGGISVLLCMGGVGRHICKRLINRRDASQIIDVQHGHICNFYLQSGTGKGSKSPKELPGCLRFLVTRGLLVGDLLLFQSGNLLSNLAELGSLYNRLNE